MLLSRRKGRLCLITHPEHGRLAGLLGRRWGNDRFVAPEVGEALLIAAAHHDDGWSELDGGPSFNAEEGRPAHFLELPLEATVPPYGRGVDSVYARDPHAGVLVSMHWTGLYRQRWGLQDGSPVSHPLAAEVVAEQEKRWAGTLREAWGGRGLRSEFECQTWHAYEVLQGLDFLSLAICLLDTSRPSADGDVVPMPLTLPRVEQPAGPRSVPAVPLGAGAGHVDLTLRVKRPGVLTVDPYPFSEPGFEVDVQARWMEDRRYGSAEESARAYHDAPVDTLRIEIVGS
jgi:Protein of unknown function (DUF3891)